MSTLVNQHDLPFDSIVRVSRIGGRENMMSPDVQRADNAAAAARHGVRLAEEFEELDESGGKVLDRRGLGKAVKRALDGETAGIIVPRLNRFARNLFDATVVMRRLEKAGRLLISNAEGVAIGPGVTAEAALMRDIMLRMAQYERERYTSQLNAARERAIEDYGINLQVPFGYQRGVGHGAERRLIPNEHEAETVRYVFTRRGADASWHTIADELNANPNMATPRKMEQWTHGAVRRIVASRVYLGEARSGGVRTLDEDGDTIESPLFIKRDAHEPLISVEAWERAAANWRPTPVRRGNQLLLSGLIRCSSCGVRMAGNFRKYGDGGYTYYRCRAKHSFGRCPAPRRIRTDRIDVQVEAVFAQEFSELEFEPSPADATVLDEAQAQLDKRQRQLQSYTSSTDYADLRDEQPEVAAATVAAYRERLATAEADFERLADQHRGFRLPHDVVAMWPRYSTEEKRGYLALAYGAVSFNAAGQVVIWRHDEADELDLPRVGHMALRPLPVDDVPGRAGKMAS